MSEARSGPLAMPMPEEYIFPPPPNPQTGYWFHQPATLSPQSPQQYQDAWGRNVNHGQQPYQHPASPTAGEPPPPPLPPRPHTHSRPHSVSAPPHPHNTPQILPPLVPTASVPSPTRPSYESTQPRQPSFADSVIQPDSIPTFSNASAVATTPPLHLTREEIFSSATGVTLYTVTRASVHLPAALSSKPLLTFTRTARGLAMGTLRFHHLSTSHINVTVSGVGETVLSTDGMFAERWKFKPCSPLCGGRMMFWRRNKDAFLLCEGSKKGDVVAKMEKGVLEFSRQGLEEVECDEVLITAFAVWESSCRKSKDRQTGGEWGMLAANDKG